MRIQHNIMAMNAYRNYTNNVSAMKKNLERLSSGYKINRAGDDAAGLAISEKMRAQITGLETAQKNAKDGISLVQTAEGALTEVHDMLNRMVELATMSANGTYDNTTDRAQLQKELDQLRTEIDRIADSANFNGIKLLNGDLGMGGLIVEDGLGTSETDFTQGIEFLNGTVGGGTSGSFSFELKELFGDGDKLEITFSTSAMQAAGITPDAAASALNANTVTLTFGTDFTGTTKEDQAASIAEKLASDSNIAAHFKVESNGESVILTNLNEGNDQVIVTGITAAGTNQVATVTALGGTGTTLAAGEDGVAPKIKFADILKTAAASGGWDFSKGDVLTFEIKDINGKVWTAELEINDKVFSTDHDTTVANIIKALNGTLQDYDDIYFKDVSGTVLDESKFKFSDMFTATAENSGADLQLAATSAGIRFSGTTGDATVKTSNKLVDPTGAGKTSTQVTDRTQGTNEKVTIKFDTTKDANLSYGDKMTFNGILADGGKFSISLTAGVDFAIGSDLAGTMNNLVAILQNGNGIDVTLTYTDEDGKETTRDVKSTDIFGATKELKLTGTSDGLTIEGTVGGMAGSGGNLSKLDDLIAGFTAATSGFVFEAAEKGDLSSTLVNGSPRTAAKSTLTFDEGVQYGSTIKVGDDIYEIVAAEEDAREGHLAIVMNENDLNDGAKVAKAFTEAFNKVEEEKVKGMKDDDGNDLAPAVKATRAGNVVTLTTRDVGTTIAAPQISAVGGQKPAVEFTLDPKKITADSYVKINGTKYQFVASEDTRVAEDVVRVVVGDAAKATSKELGEALKAAVEAYDPETSVEVAEDGLVTVSDAAQNEDGTWTTPVVGFYNGKGGLTLQIGDTADSWNQLKVNIRDAHCDSLGLTDEEGNILGKTIAQISIADQDAAAEAIDVIKAAINNVSDIRGTLGATQNRLDHTINNLSVMTENIQDAESTIRDTDIAEEMMAYTKNNILIQSAQAMLAQANQVPQGVLQLLQ